MDHGTLSIRLSEAHQEGDWELIEEIIQEWECENETKVRCKLGFYLHPVELPFIRSANSQLADWKNLKSRHNDS